MEKSKKFKAAYGCKYSDEQAQEIGECIDELKESFNGEIKPSHVLDLARRKGSQLHKYFEWDNEIAAEKYRIQQARYMIQQIYVVIETPGGPKETRAFVSVSSEGEEGKRYVSVVKALTNENYRAQIIEEAMQKIHFWRNRYKEYHELTPIFSIIDEFDSENIQLDIEKVA